MLKYTFREDGPLAIKNAKIANAQVIGEALHAISEKADGQLKPHAVVEAARDRKHPLHKHFEWDDKIAADAYRLDQARAIIRVIRIEDDEAAEGPARAFVSITDRGGTSYRQAEEIKNSADLQVVVLRQAERDLAAFERRYRDLKELCAAIFEARQKIAARLDKLERRTAA